jgi:hypothetical protein
MAINTEEKDEEDVVGADADAGVNADADAVAGAGADADAGDDAGAAVSTSNDHHRDEFPDAFYCPLTKKIMVDPVVDTSGESFERSAVEARDKREEVTAGVTYYHNRALKTVIERELQRHEEKGSLRGRVRALDESLRSGFGRLVGKSVLPLPDSFYCPITLELIRKPVIDPDGRTFEHDAICNWIRANGTSPVTRNALAVNQLRINEALYDLMEDEKERRDESIHPSIRRWKMEDQTVETPRVRPMDPPGAFHGGVGGSDDGAISPLVGAEGDTTGYDNDSVRQHERSFRQSQMDAGRLEAAARRYSQGGTRCTAVGIMFLIMTVSVLLFIILAWQLETFS